MRCPFSLYVIASIVVTALAPSRAAQAAETGAKPDDDGSRHLTSLEVMVRPTLGGAGASSPIHLAPNVPVSGTPPKILDGSAAPYGSAFGVGAELGFRFHPLISAGFRGDVAQFSAVAPGDGTTELSRSQQSAGFYARAYPFALSESIRRWVDPWIAGGVTYIHDEQNFHQPLATSLGTKVDGTWKLDYHGIGIPIAAGVDYRVTRALAIGPSFEYVFLLPIAGCARASAAGFADQRLCTDNDSTTKALVADATGRWTVGIDIRLTPF